MPITRAEVEKIGDLANLELTATEKQEFAEQLGAIVAYIDELDELDTSKTRVWQHESAGAAINSFATRDDIVEPSLGQEKATESAPDPDDGSFRVPRVIGG